MADISTDEIFVGEDFDKILTDELERLDDEKAAANHTHTPASIGAAAATHYHDYAATGHAHNIDGINGLEDALAGKAASTHTHTPASIGAATTTHIHNEYASNNHTHNEFAGASHVHTMDEVTGLEDALDGKAASGHTHTPASIGAAPASHTHDYAESDHTHTASEVGAAAASHTHTPASIGAAAASHSHNYAAANHGHSYNDLSDKPTIPSAYTHPSTHPATMITGLAGVATSGSYNDLTDKPTIPTIPASLPANGGNADTVDGKHASDFATASHTHSGFAASGHTHTAAALLAMAGALFGTNDIGGVEYSYGSGATSNLLTTMAAWPQGLHTAYVIAGTNGAPPVEGESWRIIAHKTSATIGWFLAFGSSGSIYANYQNTETTFRGWKAIFDYGNAPLWTGGRYMTQDHTVTPTKKLSECRTGWMLLWSDYDPDTGTVNNTDFCTTFIPKRNGTGGTWNGSAYYCDIPRYTAGTATDSESRVIKVLNVYDAKLVGTANNSAAPRNDVVLRAVYEF